MIHFKVEAAVMRNLLYLSYDAEKAGKNGTNGRAANSEETQKLNEHPEA